MEEFGKLFEEVLLSDFDYYPKEKKKEIADNWKGESLKKKLDNPKLFFVVAKEKGKMVGFSVGKLTKKGVAFGRWTGVLPEYQGKGIGTTMKKKFEERAKEKGAKKLRSSTYKWENRHYLKKLGYKFDKKKKGQGVDLPRYVFIKNIENSSD